MSKINDENLKEYVLTFPEKIFNENKKKLKELLCR